MANFLWEALALYEKWASGGDLSEEEVYRLSYLLGAPTRRLEVALDRYRNVIGGLVEERCSQAPVGGEVCIYTWSRRAFKRYFPAAIDAGGTVVYKPGDGRVELLSYPLHRARDLGVRGVSLPQASPYLATGRVDGWQVNLYWDGILKSWVFSTRFVLHNMTFKGGRLVVGEYGERINPLVAAAERLAEEAGLYKGLAGMEGWTLTFMIKHRKPASIRGIPGPHEAESLEMILLASRAPDGRLLDPLESSEVAKKLGVASIGGLAIESLESLVDSARLSLERPGTFLWYHTDPEHPEIYEVKSEVYHDYVRAVELGDAKSLVVLLTSETPGVYERLRDSMGGVVDDVGSALKELEDSIRGAGSVEGVREVLAGAGIESRLIKSASKALGEGRVKRALRLIAVSVVEGFKAGEAATVLRNMARAIREAS